MKQLNDEKDFQDKKSWIYFLGNMGAELSTEIL